MGWEREGGSVGRDEEELGGGGESHGWKDVEWVRCTTYSTYNMNVSSCRGQSFEG